MEESLKLLQTLQADLSKIESQIPPIHDQFAILEKYEVPVDPAVSVARTHTHTHAPSGVPVKLSPKYTFITRLYSIFDYAFIWVSALIFSRSVSLCLCRCWSSCWLWMQSGCGSSRLWLTVTSCWRNTKTWWRVGWSSPLRSLRRRHSRPYRASLAMVNRRIHIFDCYRMGKHTHTVKYCLRAYCELHIPACLLFCRSVRYMFAPQAFAFWDRGCSAWWGVLGRAINLPHAPRHITTN